MNKTNFSIEKPNILKNEILCGNIDIQDDVLHEIDNMVNKNILKQHKYPITYGKGDNRWHTYVPDETKANNRKAVAKRKREDLEDYLIKFYIEYNRIHNNKSFEKIFYIVQDEKISYIKSEEKKISALNTRTKTECEFRRFFSDTKFKDKQIDKITSEDIEDICFYNLKKYSLKKKSFASLRGILKSVFDYAYSEYLIQDNVYERVKFKKFDNMYIPDVPINKRAHSDEEIQAFLAEIHSREKIRPMYSSVWALELQILIGLRRGEIPALTWDKVSDEGLYISQEQLTTKDNHFVIVDHTKTYKNRIFPMTDDLRDFLTRLKAMHEKYYPDCKYLFPNRENTAPITNRAVYLVYRNMCKKLGIEKEKGITKGPHSFRRNVSTSLINSNDGNLLVASALLGHSPEVAKQNYLTGIDINLALSVANKRHIL